MQTFPSGNQATADAFPTDSGLGLGHGCSLGPSNYAVGVLLNVFNASIDLQPILRDTPTGYKLGDVIYGFPQLSQSFPGWVGFQARSHTPGVPAQIVAQLWEVTDGPMPATPLLNLATLNSEGSIVPPGSSPSGTILAFAGGSIPTGFLLCDGSSYATTAYPTLFNAIGYTWGGAGSAFNVPDLRGRALFGLGTNPDVNAVAKNEGLAEADRSPVHNTTVGISDPGHHHTPSGGGNFLTDAGSGAIVGSAGPLHNDPQTATATTGIIADGGPGRLDVPADTPAFATVQWMIAT